MQGRIWHQSYPSCIRTSLQPESGVFPLSLAGDRGGGLSWPALAFSICLPETIVGKVLRRILMEQERRTAGLGDGSRIGCGGLTRDHSTSASRASGLSPIPRMGPGH